jgi:hypothetical protein
MFMGGRDGKYKVVKQYPSGSQQNCFIDPDHPSKAVINRGFTANMWVNLIPMVFLVVGLVGIICCIHHGSSRKRVGQARKRKKVQGLVEETPGGEGPVMLKAESSSIARFIGIIAIALFWNVIVAVFVTEAVKK